MVALGCVAAANMMVSRELLYWFGSSNVRCGSIMSGKRYKWHTFLLEADKCEVPRDVKQELQERAKGVTVDDDLLQNAELSFYEQLKSRFLYDYSAQLEFNDDGSCSVSIPMLGFDSYSPDKEYALSKNGLTLNKDDSPDGRMGDEQWITAQLLRELNDGSTVLLYYPLKGILDAMRTRALMRS